MATEMSTGKTFALIFGILLIGPIMFLTSRFLSLGQRFEKVHVGDDVAAVRATMGAPAEETTANGVVEYHYTVPVLPNTWIITIRDGKVAAKEQR